MVMLTSTKNALFLRIDDLLSRHALLGTRKQQLVEKRKILNKNLGKIVREQSSVRTALGKEVIRLPVGSTDPEVNERLAAVMQILEDCEAGTIVANAKKKRVGRGAV